MKLHLLKLTALTGVLLISIFVEAPYSSSSIPEFQLEKAQLQLSKEELRKLARSITVRVVLGDGWGSGILVGRTEQVYTVLTNQHVLDNAKSYRVQTPDGHIYPVTLLSSFRTNDDLALLQFRSPERVYAVATLSSSKIAVDEQVFSTGFPLKIDTSDSANFEFTTGKISIVLDRPFVGGYQIGYTNEVKRGMSGGPVLDRHGVVVAINGMRKYPLWGDPYVFKDGSTVSEAMWQRMTQLSWAVPIQNFQRLIVKSHLAPIEKPQKQ